MKRGPTRPGFWIVNDIFGDTPLAVTYCPLCGSGLAFIRVVDGEETEFGVSGLLHNNDLIMYDRKTNSIWQQITGRCRGFGMVVTKR